MGAATKLGTSTQERMAVLLDQLTIILVDRALCHTWAEVGDQARRNGRPIQAADAWSAATAIALNVPLVTNNRDDFAGLDGLLTLAEV